MSCKIVVRARQTDLKMMSEVTEGPYIISSGLQRPDVDSDCYRFHVRPTSYQPHLNKKNHLRRALGWLLVTLGKGKGYMGSVAVKADFALRRSSL